MTPDFICEIMVSMKSKHKKHSPTKAYAPIRPHHVVKLAGAFLLCQGAGMLGGAFTYPAVSTWYAMLTKPIFTPPTWVFGPVWIVLYFLMALALYRAVIKKASLKWFFIQLVLNVVWSYLFFGLHEIGLALVEIVVLLGAIVATILEFQKKDMLAVKLLIPYAAWVAFAMILNLFIWLYN